MIDLERALERAREYWDSKIGLGILLAGIAAAWIFWATEPRLAEITPRNWLILVVLLKAAFAVWHWTKLPRAKRGSIGVGIAISPESDTSIQRVVGDLSSTFRSLAASRADRVRFDVVEFSQGVSKRLKPDHRVWLMRRCRLVFLLHGQVGLRHSPEGEQFVFVLSGTVLHREVSPDALKAFREDFGFVLPERWRAGRQEEIILGEYAARHIDIVALYVIGAAAHMAHSFALAESLLLEAQASVERPLPGKMQNRPAAVLRSRIITRLGAVYSDWRDMLTHSFTQTRDARLLEDIDQVSTKLLSLAPDNHHARLSLALTAFSLKKNPALAERLLDECAAWEDGTWMFSKAFLRAYSGDLDGAYRWYMKAAGSPLSNPTIPTQIEEFITEVLEKEPERYQLHYCLGLINLKVKGDYGAALVDFEQFVSQARARSDYQHQIAASEKYIRFCRSLAARGT